MKILFILFITYLFAINLGFANYVKQSELETNSISKVYSKKIFCGKGCVKIPFGYNKKFHVLKDEMIDDFSKPVFSAKEDIESCLDEIDCQSKHEAKVCTNSLNGFYSVKNLNLLEVYCTKISGYEKKLSGRKIVEIDKVLKSEYESSERSKKELKQAKKVEFDALKLKLEQGGNLNQSELNIYLLHLAK